jgi:hypothetical protein
MQRLNDARLGDRENLVAPFEGGPTKVVGVEMAELEIGARRAVKDDDAFRQSL